MKNVTIKGSKNGITIYIDSNDFESVKKEIVDKIERGKNFFLGSDIILKSTENGLDSSEIKLIINYLKEEFNISASVKEELKIEEVNEAKKEEAKEKVFQGIYEGRTKFYRSTIRSGQKVNYNGNIIVIGDVNSGAEVIASGNIIVLGVLRGIAHAGANGNRKAVVAAYSLKPTQLRIDTLITRAPDEQDLSGSIIPEVAKIKDDSIIIEPYLPNKYL
ncbi:MAG: septum site-determining protein MinC [Clostridium sp.]